MRNRLSVVLTLLLAGLVAVASAAGLWVAETYAQETVSWAAQGRGQDFVDLFVVVPALLVIAVFLARGAAGAAFVWQGILLYLVYSFVLYAFFMHFNFLFPIYVAVLGLSTHLLIASGLSPTLPFGSRTVIPNPLRITTAVFFISCSALFAMMWLGEVIPSLIHHVIPPSAAEVGFGVNPVHVLDLAGILPAMGIAATKLMTRDRLAVAFALPLLVFNVVMTMAIMGMFYMMQKRGLHADVVPALMMSILLAISAILVFRFLRTFDSSV